MEYYINKLFPVPRDFYRQKNYLQVNGLEYDCYYFANNIYFTQKRTVVMILNEIQKIENIMNREGNNEYIFKPYENIYRITRVSDDKFQITLINHNFNRSPSFEIRKVRFPDGNWYKCPVEILEGIKTASKIKHNGYNITYIEDEGKFIVNDTDDVIEIRKIELM